MLLARCSFTLCSLPSLCRDSLTLCIQIVADAPEPCPLSPAAPAFSAPTRQSKKLSRQNRPLAVYNPQALDIQTGKIREDAHLYVSSPESTVEAVAMSECCYGLSPQMQCSNKAQSSSNCFVYLLAFTGSSLFGVLD